jgi:putative FmdB family regulatory protein
MPIYAYRCESCGFEKDVLQKISDAPLTQCPSCGADAFRKQVTAAGFQLKGSGWYVTDFRGGNSGQGGGNGGGGNGTSAPATGAKTAGDPAPAASSSEGSKPAGDSAASSSTAGASTTPSTAGAT